MPLKNIIKRVKIVDKCGSLLTPKPKEIFVVDIIGGLERKFKGCQGCQTLVFLILEQIEK